VKLEHSFEEYKSDFPPKNELKAEIVSFLNSRTGGTIYLGANDDGTSVKFLSHAEKYSTYKAWEEKLANWVTNAFSPDVIGLIFVDPTTEPMTIRVSAGIHRPYYYKDGEGFNPKGVWIRVGSTKRRAGDDEIKRMMIADVAHHYERQVTNRDLLDFSYVSKRLAALGIEFDDFGLEIRKPGENYNNAGLILSESNPFVTKVAIFEGVKVDTFLDKKEYTGSIAEQIDKVMDYMKLVIRERNIITGSPQRTVLPDYPAKAVREAILNCYCHRDLTLSADIRVFVFDDRIEVYSPGGAPEELTIEEILNGANAKRNPILVKALDKLDYIENYTSGIRRIIGEYEDFPLQPEFYVSESLFRVTLYNKNYYYDRVELKTAHDTAATVNATVNATVSATQNEILGLIRRDRSLTLSQLAELTAKHRVTVARNIKALRTAGLIGRVGSDKNGYWRVNQILQNDNEN
jgi:predicted HTH transcriptional regulator